MIYDILLILYFVGWLFGLWFVFKVWPEDMIADCAAKGITLL